jgi:signal peptidase I
VTDPVAAGTIRAWLETGETLELRILSGSMWPAIRAGDRVRVTAVRARRLRWGDIVLVQIKDRPTVHRVRRLAPAIITRGDGSPSDDQPLSDNDLLGVVTAVERHGRWFRLPMGRLNLPVAVVLIALAKVTGPVRRRL